MYYYFNNHPEKKISNNSTTQALSRLLGCSWTIAHYMLSFAAMDMQETPNSLAVFDKIMRDSGYRKCVVTNDKGDGYTVKNFCKDHKAGRYIAMYDGGVVACIDGDYFNAFDCGNEIVLIFWMKE